MKRDFSLTVVSDVTEKEIFDVVVYLKEILGA